jgi:glycosyltransferase involved in cell wall biosynthesis
MNILHNTSGVGQKSFGVGSVALNLAREQLKSGCNVQIWCHSSEGDISWANKAAGFEAGRITGFPLLWPKQLHMSTKMETAAKNFFHLTIDIIHQHSLWTGVSRTTNIFRKNFGIPSVIAPHGTLSSWALNRSRWKKKIALVAYEGHNLHNASCLHATAENEVNDFRDFGLTNPIALIRNGASEQSLQASGNEERFRVQFQIPKGKRILFFLSRITPKKGLPMLIEAIKLITEEWSDWLLVIAGTDEFGHKREIEELVNSCRLTEKVKFLGPLFDQDKLDGFAAADLFILPSYSEGSPIVILEALAAGVPVIATKACPWENLATYNCGWWIDINAVAIKASLLRAAKLTPSQLREKGQLGKDMVTSYYAWNKLSEDTVALYEWLLGAGEKPEFVLLD